MKVIANWKMHGFKDDYLHWYKNLSKTTDENLFDDLGIAPPFTLLDECKTHQSKIKLGAQNISHLPEGPVTGEISAAMIKNSGADFVILGHSERRELHTETEEVIKYKILEASNHNIHPVLCIGEPKEIYAAKKTEDFLYSQLQGSLNNLNNINLSIAYEPIWAIGTGDVAKPSDINKIHSIIKEICSREFDVKLENIIYGGSVNDQNSKEIFEQPITVKNCIDEYVDSLKKNINILNFPIDPKKINKSIISTINKYLRLSSLILKKFFSIKVKNVIKPSNNVTKKTIIKNRFLFINACINLIYIKFKKK